MSENNFSGRKKCIDSHLYILKLKITPICQPTDFSQESNFFLNQSFLNVKLCKRLLEINF